MTYLQVLSERSDIPTPTAQYSSSIRHVNIELTAYDGRKLPVFLLDNGAKPQEYRQFLSLNRIGRVFQRSGEGGLERGRRVMIPKNANQFLAHPEA